MTPQINFYLLIPLAAAGLIGINLLGRFLVSFIVNTGAKTIPERFRVPAYPAVMLVSDPENDSNSNEDPEVKILQNALEFSKLKVRDCMIPRNEIEALEATANLKELRGKFIESGYSKILIYDDSIDNFIGYVSSKELFKAPESIKSILVKLSIVPESMQVNKLLHNLITERKSIALVVDEYGGTSGIITLEDIMEEIFGEIEDEHDTQDFIERQINDREFILSGRLEIDYLNEKYNLNIPETEDYDTLAGFIIFHYENIPKLNTRIVVKDLNMRVLKVSQTRVELVYVSKSTSSE